jgi:hypothetical protein
MGQGQRAGGRGQGTVGKRKREGGGGAITGESTQRNHSAFLLQDALKIRRSTAGAPIKMLC